MKHSTKYWKLFSGLLPILLCVLAVGWMLVGAQPASAQGTCIQDVWQAHNNSQSLTCTAKDVSLSSVDNICVDDGSGGCLPESKCTAGTNVTFTADFTMPLTAQARYDLGLYIASDGGGNDGALTGQCINNVVTTANSDTFFNLDASPDVCGDIDAAHNPQVISQTVTTLCSDPDGDGFLNLPWCTSWRQPGSNEICDTTQFTTAATWDAFPGSPSKCNCGDLNIGITIESPTGALVKTVTQAVVTYTVQITNTSTTRSVDIFAIEDDGTPICPDLVGDTLAPGATSDTCTYTATFPAPGTNGDHQNTVTATLRPSGNTDDSEDVDVSDTSTVNIQLLEP